MNKLFMAVLISLVTGFAAGAILLGDREAEPLAARVDAVARSPLVANEADKRLAALEAAIAEERQARQLLEDEILALFTEIEALRRDRGDVEISEARTPPGPAPNADFFTSRRSFDESPTVRSEALLEAGFPPEQAAWILQREDELRIAALEARFEAQRTGDMQAMFAANTSSATLLREELGDADYERYLEAYGRPTAVAVGNVLESSPGQRAGLQRGDAIVRYDGQRVFSYGDLNAGQLQGTPGESVVVDILRDGMPMQLVMPRGPIGIEPRRSWRR